MDLLPVEILLKIFSYLSPEDRAVTKSVCNLWYILIIDNFKQPKLYVFHFTNTISRIEWARDNGCPWNKLTCAYAAKGGHLEVLQWARANGYPWDKWTCSYAAKGGHLEVLQWARENGCPE